MKNWNNIKEVFSHLNDSCEYLVMRNYEGFYDDILLEVMMI